MEPFNKKYYSKLEGTNSRSIRPPTAARPTTSQPEQLKLTWIHLRYYPPGLILEYMNEGTGKKREKVIDLLDLHSRSKLKSVTEDIMRNEPLFNSNNKPTLVHCLEKLKARCKHDYEKRFTPDYQLIRTHSMPVLAACINRKGDRCATGGFDKTCKIWDSNGHESHSLTGHYDAVSCVLFDSTGDKILTGSYDGTLHLWKIDEKSENECLHTLPGTSEEIHAIQFSGDGFLCAGGSNSKTARVFDLTSGLAMYSFTGHEGGVNNVSFDSKCSTLLTGSFDSKLGLWDLRSGKLIDFLKGHQSEIMKCSFDFKCDRVISCSLDQTVRLWDVRCTNQSLAILTDNTDEVLDVQFNSTGNTFASACKNGKVVVWDTGTSSTLLDFQAHTGSANQIQFSPSGGFLLTCGDDSKGKIWHAGTGDCIQTLGGHKEPLFYTSFNYYGDVVLTASKDNSVQFWR